MPAVDARYKRWIRDRKQSSCRGTRPGNRFWRRRARKSGAAGVRPGRAGAVPRSGPADQVRTAFREIDRLFHEFATSRVPGAAWGIVIDGELAHTGSPAIGSSRRRPPWTRLRVSHCLDDEKLYRDGDPEPPRRRQALARRSRRTFRSGARRTAVPDERFAADHHPPLAVARGRVSGGQPVGRPATRRHRRARCSRCCAQAFRFPTRRASPTSIRTTGSRSWADRRAGVGPALRDVRGRKNPAPARDDRDDAGAPRVPQTGLRTATGGRTISGRTNRCCPTAPFGPMGGMLTSVRDLSRYVGAFLAAWPPRDGPETGPIRRSSLREMQQIARANSASAPGRRRRRAVERRRLRLRPRHQSELQLPSRRRAQRRASRFWIVDAVAAGIRRRNHRVRKPDLHGLGPRGHDSAWRRWRKPAACSRARRNRRRRSSNRATRCHG